MSKTVKFQHGQKTREELVRDEFKRRGQTWDWGRKGGIASVQSGGLSYKALICNGISWHMKGWLETFPYG